jgi:hypothetical protein
MRINEVVGKVDTSNPDPMQSAYTATKNLFSPSTWFKGKDKPVDPNVQKWNIKILKVYLCLLKTIIFSI